MPADDPRRAAISGPPVIRDCAGVAVRLHPRSYYHAWRDKSFCGGVQDQHYWIEKADLLALLPALGFTSIETAHEQPDHANGPCFCLLARKHPPDAKD